MKNPALVPSECILLCDCDGMLYRAGFSADKKFYNVKRDGGDVAAFTSKKELNAWLAAVGEETDGLEINHIREAEPVEFALHSFDTIIKGLADRFPESNMEFYIGGEGNFRKELATLQPYKGNRSEFDRPTHYQALRDFVIKKYNAILADGQEADDAVGIRATELGNLCIIVTQDKDLNNIPGWHFNWVDKELFYVTEQEANKHFYTQLLTGDQTDNIPGLSGVGPATAAKLLQQYTKPKSLYQCVLAEYAKRHPDGFMGKSIRDALVEIGNLLYIRKHPNEKWSPP